ncbi:MAG: hypothetical protein JW795_10065 [Chitinivibrionales bacterium]|nr:hypothetical protein [Chitinivibrionales bacterium]
MKKVLLSLLLASVPVLAQLPHTFNAGDSAKASEVNDNFNFLMGRIDTLVKANERLEAMLDTLESRADLPIGTVIAALKQIDTSNGFWVLADGRTATTEYFQATGKADVPDLRGLFLRGLNAGREDGREDPEGAGRTAGDYQADTLKTHQHLIGNTWTSTGQEGSRYAMGTGASVPNNWLTYATGGAETRPRNAAVYWYVKVK